jgi:DNA-binding GntR family transcriptional regulator
MCYFPRPAASKGTLRPVRRDLIADDKPQSTGRPSPNNGIPRTSLTEAVADRLREMIMRGEIQEGEQLRQEAIAADLQVSPIPVREALRQLEAEGLIKIIAHRGAVVSSLSSDDIEELFDIRALLECEVLRLSIPNLTQTDFEKAEEILKAYEKLLWMKGDVCSWGRLNSQFHAVLYSRANRPHFMPSSTSNSTSVIFGGRSRCSRSCGQRGSTDMAGGVRLDCSNLWPRASKN